MRTYLDEAKERRPELFEKLGEKGFIAVYCPKDLRLEKVWPDCLTKRGGHKMECGDCWRRPMRR